LAPMPFWRIIQIPTGFDLCLNLWAYTCWVVSNTPNRNSKMAKIPYSVAMFTFSIQPAELDCVRARHLLDMRIRDMMSSCVYHVCNCNLLYLRVAVELGPSW
jgi:hypothetical protein